MWGGEVVRMLRAVHFCAYVADAINTNLPAADPPALSWDAWRHGISRRNIHWTYLSVVAAMYTTALASIIVGITRASDLGWSVWIVAAIVALYAALGIGIASWLVAIVRYWRSAGVALPSALFNVVLRVARSR